MSQGVSIVVCCYNSAERLPNTLAHLSAQEVPSDLPWEVIVVNNASTDNTVEVAHKHWSKKTSTPLQAVNESQPGVAHARRKGFAEAKYEIVCFVDDDNWVCPEWISIVSDLMTTHPDVGACGGAGEAVSKMDLPWWFEKFQSHYAVGPQSVNAGDITLTRGYLWGAGLAIRKSAWSQLLNKGYQPLLTDREGASLSAGGDAELCFALRLTGWRLWYEPRLKFKHLLPSNRLQWSYLRGLYRGFGAAEAVLDAYQFARDGGLAKRKGRFLQNTCLRQIIIETKALLRFREKLLRAIWQPPEGDPDVLDIERLTGKIRELWRIRDVYEQHLRMAETLVTQQKIP
jgi:glycosyltransferase involved in cell wall biosynthesis